MTAKQTRPAGDRTGQKAFRGAEAILPDATPDGTDPRPRCAGCGHVLTAPQSIARGRGPVCEERYRLECARSATAGVLENLAVVVESAPLLSLRQLGRALWDLEQEFYWPAVDARAAEGVRRG